MNCEQHECKEKAIAKMYWPNHPPKLICEIHKKKAESIAGAMGFYIHFEDLNEIQ